MALINCSECGREVSDCAEVCPHCGNRIRKQSTNVAKITPRIILNLLGCILVGIAPFLVYESYSLNMLGSISTFKYNMWQIFTPEAGGTSDLDWIWRLIPTILIIFSVIGVAFSLLEIKKKTKAIFILHCVLLFLSVACLIIYEYWGLKSFRNTYQYFEDSFNSSELLKGSLVRNKGISFYVIISGLATKFISLLLPGKKDRNE